MRKKYFRSLVAASMLTVMFGTTVFADDVTDIKNQQSTVSKELSNTEDQLAYLLTQMDELEISMGNKNDEIEKTNKQLDETQKSLDAQYQDMKLRIKYMYEDQATSITDVFLTSESMGDVLNKTEYVQRVYDYDREKLDKMAKTAAEIKDLKANLEKEKKEMEQMAEELTNKQALLYSTIDELKGKEADLEKKLKAAQEKAARSVAPSYNIPVNYTSNNNSSVASGVVASAYNYLGVPYVYGGSSPSGFDCSGFTSYLYAQYGIYLSRSSSAQAYGGQGVSVGEMQPGDIVCYAGHVALYIGGGQIIHAPVPGDVVKVASVYIMPITSVRRYW